MKERLYIHSHIHNNVFLPDSAIVAEVSDETWKQDYDFENIATRHLGNNLHIIVSIPHLIHGFQRYDLVRVNEETDMITKLEHRGRNTSARFVFDSNISETEQREIMDYFINMGCALDLYNVQMIAIDLDIENSRASLKIELNKLLESRKIIDWEYVIQD